MLLFIEMFDIYLSGIKNKDMTIQEFKKQSSSQDVCTTNGWGFGGYYGKLFTLGQFEFRNAKWGHRHSGASNYDAYFISGKEVDKATFLEALSTTEINHNYQEFVPNSEHYIYGLSYCRKDWKGNKLVDKY
jgi:hypothetical protein